MKQMHLYNVACLCIFLWHWFDYGFVCSHAEITVEWLDSSSDLDKVELIQCLIGGQGWMVLLLAAYHVWLLLIVVASWQQRQTSVIVLYK